MIVVWKVAVEDIRRFMTCLIFILGHPCVNIWQIQAWDTKLFHDLKIWKR